MAYARASRLEEDLGRLQKELASARRLEREAAERHDRMGTAETEAVLEARRTRIGYLLEERERVAVELGRLSVAEGGWHPDAAGGTGSDGRPAPSPACGMSGTLRVGPHPLLPERGWLIHDRSEGTVAWVRSVPSPKRAAEILEEHGREWDPELLSHSLSPVPEEAEGH